MRPSLMPSFAKLKKRDLILAASLKLFNEKGSSNVTTNHIAKAMGISPGNLYYHFKNKEHIIRELLSQLIEKFDSLIGLANEAESGTALMARIVKATGEFIYAYRFIYIELAALLARDNTFKTLYRGIKQRRAQEFILLFDVCGSLDIFARTITPLERDALIVILWTYAEGVVTSLATSGLPITRATVQTQLLKIGYLLKPYLQPAIWTDLAEKLELG